MRMRMWYTIMCMCMWHSFSVIRSSLLLFPVHVEGFLVPHTAPRSHAQLSSLSLALALLLVLVVVVVVVVAVVVVMLLLVVVAGSACERRGSGDDSILYHTIL